jgi:hypothetical protein
LAVATALGDLAQVGDCAWMKLRLANTATVTFSSEVAAQNDAARCWKQ